MAFKKRITLSAGHGLSSRRKGAVDPGAVGLGDKEATWSKTMTSNLSQDFARLKWSVLFRDTGYFATADDDAHKFGASVFVEVHWDAAGASAQGTSAYVAAKANGKEKVLAGNITKRIAAVGFRNRGVKATSTLAVLRQYAGMDSVLVEVGYITNKHDNDLTGKKFEAIELAIMNGILETYGQKTFKSLPRKWNSLRSYLYLITRR